MKILIVCSKNSGKIAPFILEQANSLLNCGLDIDFFTVEQKGWIGYIKSRKSLLQKIAMFKPDILHAHYGLSGLLANLQRRVPVVTTYHGTDINNDRIFKFSKVAILLSKYNIFVSAKNVEKSNVSKNYALIPCGVDTTTFKPQEIIECRKKLRLDLNKKYVLFAGSFNNQVKNPALALQAVAQLNDVELIELKGYSREDVSVLMNAVNVCLMTSFTEGSPQFIKEAMACGTPIVTVNVGDVKEVIANTEGCYVCDTYHIEEIVDKLRRTLHFNRRTNGRDEILTLGLDLKTTAEKILTLYNKLV